MALVLALMACNVFLGLATSSVNDFEEGRYGVTAFEMLQHRDFVVSTYAGHKELWALKPPLGYWLMALSFALFGGSTLALRLPSALCALATVAVTLWGTRRWFNRRQALIAGLIVATTFGFLSHHGARSGDFDACLTLILLLVAVQLPGLGEAPWRVVLVSLLLACGFLLKSFAILPMLLVAGAYLLWTGEWRRLRPTPVLVALALFGTVVGAWVLARWHADGSPDFLLRMVREDVVERSTAIVDRSTSSPIGYLTSLFDRFAPWPPVILAAALVALQSGQLRRLPRGRVAALLFLWIAIPLAVVSAVRTQHHWYLDPTFPPLAMLAAGSALYLVRRAPNRLRTLALVGLVALPLVLCETRLLARVLIKEPMPPSQRFLGALKPAAAGACHAIRSTFQLAYSERFILEVEDGFQVVEPPPTGAPASALRGAAAIDPTTDCLLVGKSAWRRPPPPPPDRLPPRRLLLADSSSYSLFRSAGLR